VNTKASNEEVLQRLTTGDPIIFRGENLSELAAQSLLNVVSNDAAKKKSFLLSVSKSLIKAMVVPIWQKSATAVFQLLGYIKKKNDASICFFSFASSHTAVLIPIVREMQEKGIHSFNFVRASIGLSRLPSEIKRYQQITGDKPALLEQYYDLVLLARYYVCVFSMLGRFLKYCLKNREWVRLHWVDNNPVIQMFPEFALYFAPLSYLVLQTGLKNFTHSRAFLFGFDNCPRGRALVVTAVRNQIKTVSIQHGIMAIPRFYLPYAEKIVVWNDQDAEKLISAGANRERLLVWGSPLFGDVHSSKNWTSGNTLKVIFALTARVPAIQVKKDVDLILAAISSISERKLELVIRPHPIDRRDFRRILNLRNVQISSEDDFSDLIKGCSLGIMYYSSVVFHFVLNNIPVAALLWDDLFDPTGVVQEKIVQKIRTTDDLAILVNLIERNDRAFQYEFMKEREIFLKKYLPEPGTVVCNKVISYLFNEEGRS